VDRALSAWSGGYRGYSWQLMLLEWDRNQLGQAVHIFVFLNTTGLGAASSNSLSMPQPWVASRRYHFNHLRARSDYCGSVSGFNDLIQHLTGQQTTAAVGLDSCLRAAGINPNAVSVNPAEPGAGPATAMVKPSDLRLLALNQHGRDVTSMIDFGKIGISWSLPVLKARRVEGSSGADVADKQPDATNAGSVAADTALATSAAALADTPVHSLQTGVFF